MQRLVEALRAGLRLLHRIVPRSDHAVLWGWPDHEDSVLALEQALQATPVRRVVVLMTDPTSPPPVADGPKTIRVRKDTVRGWWWFLRARYVFFTHRCFMRRFPPDVVSVNVWHGMPIKRVGALLPGDDVLSSRHVLATSAAWAEVMDRSFVATDGVLTTGLPRNDRLFLGREPAWRSLGLDDRDDVDRLVVWLPTFRRSVRGRISTDGTPTGSPFELDVDVDELDAFLRDRRTFLWAKVHPMTDLADGDAAGVIERPNLLVVDDAWLRRRSVSLYEVLGGADALISDVSSVTVDYLLLDRPIVHAMADLETYRTTRGFSVDDVDSLLAGPVVEDQAALHRALDEVLAGGDPDATRRRACREQAHEHLDAGATTRLLRTIGLLPAATPATGVHYRPEPMTGSTDDHLGA